MLKALVEKSTHEELLAIGVDQIDQRETIEAVEGCLVELRALGGVLREAAAGPLLFVLAAPPTRSE